MAIRVEPNKVLEFEEQKAFYPWLRKHWNKEQEVGIRIYVMSSECVANFTALIDIIPLTLRPVCRVPLPTSVR